MSGEELRQACEAWIADNFSERRSGGGVYECQIAALVDFARQQHAVGLREAAKHIEARRAALARGVSDTTEMAAGRSAAAWECRALVAWCEAEAARRAGDR